MSGRLQRVVLLLQLVLPGLRLRNGRNSLRLCFLRCRQVPGSSTHPLHIACLGTIVDLPLQSSMEILQSNATGRKQNRSIINAVV